MSHVNFKKSRCLFEKPCQRGSGGCEKVLANPLGEVDSGRTWHKSEATHALVGYVGIHDGGSSQILRKTNISWKSLMDMG